MKRWSVATALFVAASVALEIPFRHQIHAEQLWHHVPGFDFLYGLAGCALIVYASKWLGKASLQRPERYWDENGEGR